MADLDRATRNVLTSKFAAGLFDNPYTDETRVKVLDTPAGRKLAREAAEQGIVLLQNPRDSLPIHPGEFGSQVAILGSLANDTFNQCGGYFYTGAHVVTILEGFQTGLAGSDTRVAFSVGSGPDSADPSPIAAAVDVAKESQTVVLVLGDSQYTCGELYDRSSLDLPGAQLTLLETVIDSVSNTTKIVVVVINGRSATFGPSSQKILARLDALFVAWRPGEEGGTAVFNLVSGIANPSGKLTQAWPRSVGAVSGPGQPYLYPFQGNHMGESYAAGDGPSTALFPFGHGLSYTSFVLSNASLSSSTVSATDTFNLTVTATNQGQLSGATIVQVYFRDQVAFPVRIGSVQLLQFQRVVLQPGESKQVTILVNVGDMSFWNDGKSENVAWSCDTGWCVDPGTFDLFIGYDGFTSWNDPGGLRKTVTVLP